MIAASHMIRRRFAVAIERTSLESIMIAAIENPGSVAQRAPDQPYVNYTHG